MDSHKVTPDFIILNEKLYVPFKFCPLVTEIAPQEPLKSKKIHIIIILITEQKLKNNIQSLLNRKPQYTHIIIMQIPQTCKSLIPPPNLNQRPSLNIL